MNSTQLGFLESTTHDGRAYAPNAVSGMHHVAVMSFDGQTYDAPRDEARLTGQLAAVFEVMKDGRERSLVELAAAVGKLVGRRASEAAVSARIRDLRKAKFGGHLVEHRNMGGGHWVYRLTVREGA